MSKFIEINKVIEVHKKGNNGVVSHPSTGKPILEGYKAVKESIEIDSIKSFRPWEKNSNQELYIDGDLTLIYLKGDPTKDSQAQILIQESYDSFNKRCGVILNGKLQ
jgi:hypothetical protein